MNRDEIESMLADLLGGELPPDRRALLERHMASDAALRAEVESLRRTLGSLRSCTAVPRRRSLPAALLRWAAVVSIAFTAGWLLHAATAAPAPGPGRAPAMDVAATAPAANPADAPDWRLRFAQSYMEQPAGSDLARSLVALSRASR